MNNKMDEDELKLLMTRSDEAVGSGLWVMLGVITATCPKEVPDSELTKKVKDFLTTAIGDIRAAERLKCQQENRAAKGKEIAAGLADVLTNIDPGTEL